VANAVRCVPPENKPLPAEVLTCRSFLVDELAKPPRPRVVLALGRIAHDSTIRALGRKPSELKFGHGAVHAVDSATWLVSSYHTSRYNIQTGRLTQAMFDEILQTVMALRAQAG
jgi:uracil-DNA glycosylase family 4